MENRKNIIINFMGRNNSGPFFSLSIAKALCECGYKVFPIISKYSSNVNVWREYGFPILFEVDTYQSKMDLGYKSIKFIMRERKKIIKAFRGIKIDYVINTFFHPWSNIICDIFKEAKVITYCHDPIMHSGEGIIRRQMYPRFIKKSDEVVVLTRKFISIVEKRYGILNNRIHYSPHGRLNIYKDAQIEKCPYTVEPYDNKKINFIFFGRIEKYKGLNILADAYREVKNKYKNVSLTVVGAGDFSPYRKKFMGIKDVHIVNRYIDDEEVGWYFTGENLILVLPYLDATQSGVAMIAFEYGIPVISTDAGGLKEQFQDIEEAGIFCKTNDVLSLAESMMRFLREEELYLEQKSKMIRIMDYLEWKNIIKELMCEIELQKDV